MGYRSEVVIRIKKDVINREEWDRIINIKRDWDDYATACETEKYYHFSAEDVKWYESYDVVMNIMGMLTRIDKREVNNAGDDYAFVRMGEDFDDVETLGNLYECDLQINRTIDFI